MKLSTKRLSVLLIAAACQSVYAAPDAKVSVARADPLVGVVINRTVTVMGRDFYQFFAASWRDKELTERYSISIHERPSAIRGSELWVQFGQQRVFHAYLSPARSAVKEASAQAAEIAYQNVIELEAQRLLFQDKDLGPEEI